MAVGVKVTGARATLRHIGRMTQGQKRPVIELGFGGPAKAYAVTQHERTDLSHAEGEAKYLEKAVNNHVGRSAKIIAEVAEPAINRGLLPLTALARGLYALGNDIMKEAKRRVPVDFGVLRGSGYVTLPRNTMQAPGVPKTPDEGPTRG